jgi:GxxExxY protein
MGRLFFNNLPDIRSQDVDSLDGNRAEETDEFEGEKCRHSSMEIRLAESGLLCSQCILSYDGCPIDRYRLDWVVEGTAILELKAGESLHPRHDAQWLSCHKASALRVGLLVHFGDARLEIKRKVNEKSAGSAGHPGHPRTVRGTANP